MSKFAPYPWIVFVAAALLSQLAVMSSLLARPEGEGPYAVDRVVDGDTIRIIQNTESVSVRIIGIDTPETVHPNKPVERFGKEAKSHLVQLLADEPVYLQQAEERDRYKRRLAYVHLADGTDIGLCQIADGFAFSYRKYPHIRLDEYNAAESAAREEQRGLWAEEN